MKKPRTIEGNLISLAITLGLLLAVLVVGLLGIERSLGGTLKRVGGASTAQQGIGGLRHGVSRLFERQVQVLSVRSEAELAPLKERSAIERDLADSRRLLDRALPEIA